jgi:hypothetical protein
MAARTSLDHFNLGIGSRNWNECIRIFQVVKKWKENRAVQSDSFSAICFATINIKVSEVYNIANKRFQLPTALEETFNLLFVSNFSQLYPSVDLFPELILLRHVNFRCFARNCNFKGLKKLNSYSKRFNELLCRFSIILTSIVFSLFPRNSRCSATAYEF